MAIINTRSHIVLDKESIKKYVSTLKLAYSAIFEINTKLNAYQAVFCTENSFPALEAGSGEDFVETARQCIHSGDVQEFLAAFRRKKLRKIMKEDGCQTVDFRLLTDDGSNRWMRAVLIPDETDKHTLLCFMLDISMEKRCEELEAKNAALLAQLAGKDRKESYIPKRKRSNFTIPIGKKKIKKTAEPMH